MESCFMILPNRSLPQAPEGKTLRVKIQRQTLGDIDISVEDDVNV